MKGIIGLLIGVELLVYFSSCQKELNGDLNNKTQSDSIYIKSVFILDSLHPTSQDTVLKFAFDYDSQKRISRLREYHYDNIANSIDFSSDVRFSYSGNDSMPSVLYAYAMYFLPVYDTVYLNYNNEKIVRDSSAYTTPGSPKSFVKFDFLRVSNNLYAGSYIDSVVGFQASGATLNSYVNWQNGNLIAEKDTIHYTGGPDYIQSKDYTYDQRPNPLRKAMLNFPTTSFYFNTLTMAHGTWYLKAFANNSINNILTERISPGYDLVTWSYFYTSNGLPEKAIRQVPGSIYKVCYYYTSL
jgi:hypothetical protein